MRVETLKELTVAFVVSLTLWFYAKMNKTYEIQMKMPVEYVNVPEGMTFITKVDSVPVRVKGKGFDILKVALSRPRLVYEVPEFETSGSFPVDTAYLRPKVKVTLVPILHNKVFYEMDRETTKTVSVIPIFKGKPKKGYVFLGWSVDGMVEIRGPSKVLERTDSIPTYPIDLTGRKRDFSKTVGLFTEGMGITEVKPESVVVHVRIDTVVQVEVPVVLRDSVFTVHLIGPKRVVEDVRSLKAFDVGDSLIISKPEGTRIVIPEGDEKGDTLQQQGHKDS